MDNSDMFEACASFDPNSQTHDYHHVSNFHQIPNFSAIEAPAHHFHHQNHQQINWNHNLHDHVQIGQTSGQMYDPALLYRELLGSLPKGFNLTGCGSGFGQMYHEGDAFFEFDAGIINGKGRCIKDANHVAIEKHRRQQLNGKFDALRSLIPNPTKADRSSIIEDAIGYINKLKRNLEELKISVDRKRCNKSRLKKQKTEDGYNLDVESIYTMSNYGISDHDNNGNSAFTMKSSSWIQRKLENIEIDVRIIDDDVTIKLVQQKRINCLFLVSQVFDELKLDVHHVAGGLIGDFYSYLFNNKICEGSCVYASAIANKLIEVVDKQYATIPVNSSN